jgi:hypothetical protein
MTLHIYFLLNAATSAAMNRERGINHTTRRHPRATASPLSREVLAALAASLEGRATPSPFETRARARSSRDNGAAVTRG